MLSYLIDKKEIEKEKSLRKELQVQKVYVFL